MSNYNSEEKKVRFGKMVKALENCPELLEELEYTSSDKDALIERALSLILRLDEQGRREMLERISEMLKEKSL